MTPDKISDAIISVTGMVTVGGVVYGDAPTYWLVVWSVAVIVYLVARAGR